MPPRITEQARWFAEEVQSCEPRLRGYLWNCFPALRDVDDIVQESFLRIWRVRAAQPIRSARAFLFRIARNHALVFMVSALFGAEPAKRSFDLPADTADKSLRTFSAQAGREVVFVAEPPNGIRTNAVRGEYAPAEAARMLLAGTGLAATQDSASGAFMVNRVTDPNVERAAPRASRSGRPEENRKPPTAVAGALDDERVLLSPFEVLADSDTSYGALNSNAITRFNSELTTLPISADILPAAA